MQFSCRVENDGPSFHVTFPDWPEVETDGRTFAEALENAHDVLNGMVAFSLKRGLPVPDPVERTGQTGFHGVDVDMEKEVALAFRKFRGSDTQSEIAKRLSIPYQSYQRLERLSPGNMSLKTIEKVARAFGKKASVVFR